MFLWRSLPPSALIAALRGLLTTREEPKTAAEPAEPRDDTERKRIDQAVIEIQSRL